MVEEKGELKKQMKNSAINGNVFSDGTLFIGLNVDLLDKILGDAKKEFPEATNNEDWITLALKRGAWFKKWFGPENTTTKTGGE